MDALKVLCPKYGYCVNSVKMWLIVKEEYKEQAESVFAEEDINIRTEGQCHLGTALGCATFVKSYVSSQIH